MIIKDYADVQNGENENTYELSDVMWITDDNGNCFLRITNNGDGSFTLGCFGNSVFNEKIFTSNLVIEPVSSDSVVVGRKEHVGVGDTD